MRVFKREFARTHCPDAEWPQFLGKVSLGEPFIIETASENWPNGPISVEGIKEGDAIAVHIENIVPVGPFTCPNGGPFHDGTGQGLPLTLKDGYFIFPDRFHLKCEPSVGNIAVLPQRNNESLGYSQQTLKTDYHGSFRGWRRLVNDLRGKHSHQDAKWIREGSILHLRTQVDEAGLCAADVHGYIGEGECAFGAIEIVADVQLRVERSHGWYVDWPLIETQDEIMVCCSCPCGNLFKNPPETRYVDLVREAYRALREVVAKRINGTIQDANPIVATAMDLRNCAIYGLKGFVAERESTGDYDLSVVAALPKHVFV